MLVSLLPHFTKEKTKNLIRNKLVNYKRLSLEFYFFNIKRTYSNRFISLEFFLLLNFLIFTKECFSVPLLISQEMSPHNVYIFYQLVCPKRVQPRWVAFFLFLQKLFKLSTDFSHPETTSLSFS